MAFRKVGVSKWKGSKEKAGVHVRKVNGSPRPKVEGSRQQETIWQRMVEGDQHIVIQALAGTGKTFTVIEGFHRMGEEKSGRSAFVAFNKSIAGELKTKVPSWVEAGTFHSLLFKSVRAAYGNVQVDWNKTDLILERVLGEYAYEKMDFYMRNAIGKLVSLVKNTLIEPDEVGLQRLCDRYDVELNGGFAQACEIVPQIIEQSKEDTAIVDYDDMIWLPVVNELPLPKFDTLAVDEYQDTNMVQQTSLLRMGKRLVLVGDSNQAIYGFRGAGIDSMPNAIKELKGTEKGVEVLPLTASRRCPKLHVNLAQGIVPEFEALPEAPDGIIETISQEESIGQMRSGDLVVCRLNAPVVGMAFRLLRHGVRANIQGRDIGRGLKGLIKKLRPGEGPGSVKMLMVRLEAYMTRELDKMRALKRKPEARIAAMQDKWDCILAFCDGEEEIGEVNRRIDELFRDEEAGGGVRNFVLLSTVHRAKGLEADTVWILHPELMPHKMAKMDWEIEQEHNIRYVALTRSKRRLMFVPQPKTASVSAGYDD